MLAKERLETGSMTLGVVGLGYVGFPLAVEFATKMKVVGIDVNTRRIRELEDGVDSTNEISSEKILSVQPNMVYSSDIKDLDECDIIIVAVPTPINDAKQPDLGPLRSACEFLVQTLERADSEKFICFESTVYPGCTREVCVPILEQSGKKFQKDFFIGYSPERINPGDSEHTFAKTCKIVSGCSKESADVFNQLYSKVITGGTHLAESIEIAEAAKVIENTQRDVNIALVNELSIIFNRLNIDTNSVLEAAATKWNFQKFTPGLVGGHCIGIDPFYLTYKSEIMGYSPRVILSGRALNDSMSEFVASEVVKVALKNRPKSGDHYRCALFGFTFKENIPDVRNTKIFDLLEGLRSFNFQVDVVDPMASKSDAREEYGVELIDQLDQPITNYDAVILAVPHEQFLDSFGNYFSEGQLDGAAIFDLKGTVKEAALRRDKGSYWTL